ncbi:tetratricopeptide repeat protein [Agarivorans sp. MS3-6]
MKVLIVLLLSLVSLPTFSAGSGRYDSSTDESALAYVEKMLAQQHYERASTWLVKYVDSSKGRRSADAWNLLGFSQRKQAHYPEALYAYQQALAIDPSHLGALEYLGELYLNLGQVVRAQENLERLKLLCENCVEQQQLTVAIQQHKIKE